MSDQQGSTDLPAEDTSFLHNLLEPLQSLDWINLGWFAGVVFALTVLFAAGLKVPARLAFASRVEERLPLGVDDGAQRGWIGIAHGAARSSSRAPGSKPPR